MDYRSYAELLRKEGMLIEINEEVSWNLEAICYTAMNYRVENGQTAHIFNNVKGYKGKARLFGSFVASPKKAAWQKSAMIFGLPKDASWTTFRDEFLRRFDHPLKPLVVEAGDSQCKQHIMMGKDVNLFAFPWPMIHQSDGGRYGTIQTHIIEDPDTGWVNWGNYRMMIVSKNRMTGLCIPVQHGPSIFYQKYEARNIPAPFCYVVGGDPIINFAAGTNLPAGAAEVDYAGGFRQEPMKLVRAETNKLYVPADAEIVIEGVMMPHERLDEGPQGEYTGFVHGRMPMPVYHVHCITYRDNPLIPYSIGGATFSDEQAISQSLTLVEIYRQLQVAGFKAVKDVRFLPDLLWDGLVIATDNPYPGYIQELRAWMECHKVGLWGTQFMFVDGDVDMSGSDFATNVYQEMATKVDPKRDIYRTDNDYFCTPLNPTMDERGKKTGVGAARLLWDCTTPYEWSKEEIIKPVKTAELFPQNILDKAKAAYKRL